MIWELINKNTIIKEEDPILYAQIKEKLTGKKNRYLEILAKFNWEILITPQLILLKKGMMETESSMGIQSFKDKMDYVCLMGIYHYLNLNYDNVFIAEDVIEHLKLVLEEQNIRADFTSASMKYSIYRALIFCEKQGYIHKLDGDVAYLIEENPLTDGVLYKNTGYVGDMEIHEEKECTKNKVYRFLLAKPVIYFDDNNVNLKRYISEHLSEIEDDFQYIIGSDVNLIFQDLFAALLIPENMENRKGRREICKEFPKINMKDLLLLRMATYLREYIVSKKLMEKGNIIHITRNCYSRILTKMKKKDLEWWTKEYQNMSIHQLEKLSLKGLEEWNAIDYDDKTVTIYPLISMIQGELI